MNHFAELVRNTYGASRDGGCVYQTTHDAGHCHDIFMYEGRGRRLTSYNRGHVHQWEVKDGKIVVSEADGHTHYVPYAVIPQHLI